jgi:ATP-binding cassette subfamily B protein
VEGTRRDAKGAVSRLWPTIRPYLPNGRRKLAVLSAASVVAGFSQAGVLFLLVHAAVAVATGGQTLRPGGGLGDLDIAVPTAVTGAFALVSLMVVAELLAAHTAARMSAGAQAEARSELIADFLRTSWDVQARERHGHLQELVTTYAERVGNGAALLATGAVSLLNFAALMTTALLVNATGTLLILAGTIFLFLLLRPLAKLTRASAREQAASNAGYAMQVAEAVRMAQDVRIFNVTGAVETSIRAATRRAERTLARTRLLVRALPSVYQAAALLLVLAALAGIHAAGVTQVGGLGAVVLLLVRGLSYSQSLQAVYQQSAEVVTYVSDLGRWQETYRANAVSFGATLLARVQKVEWRDVSFAYEAGNPVLRSVSFEAHVGECIGIVGPSGAGKSTLVQILLRLRTPDAGRYLVNGADAVSYRAADFARQVAFVPQEPRLLPGAVADNIRFLRDGIDDAAVLRAAEMAHLHDDVSAWPGGYGRRVGEGADDVSGGQKQRLALARALAGDPSLLILDEPTSALDARSDELVRQTLAEIKGRLTMFVVAHRLSTLDVCDRIMVIEHGRVTAFATAPELARDSEFFRDVRRLSRLSE